MPTTSNVVKEADKKKTARTKLRIHILKIISPLDKIIADWGVNIVAGTEPSLAQKKNPLLMMSNNYYVLPVLSFFQDIFIGINENENPFSIGLPLFTIAQKNEKYVVYILGLLHELKRMSII